MGISQKDRDYLKRALRLARHGFPNPNPHVGAVVVQADVIVGEGYHPYVGAPHAEVFALRQAGEKARGATLYVTLEPCCHHGRTSPCTEAILQAGIRRVVIATLDPNPQVHGRGLQHLQTAGVQVERLGSDNPLDAPLLQKAEQINEIFFTFHRAGRPFITLKAAMSLDGKIATRTGDSKWITGEPARRYAHRLRAEHGSVLVGINTVLQDDPLLTARLRGVHNQPLRLVLDTHLRIPETAQVLDTSQAPTLVVCRQGDAEKIRRLEAQGVQIYCQKAVQGTSDRIAIPDLVQYLASRGITGVLVEGGGEVIASFLDSGICNKVVLFYAPCLIGGRDAPGAVGGRGVERVQEAWQVERVQIRHLGQDWVAEGYLNRPR